MATATDKWSEWLLEKRFGGNAEATERGMRELYRVRDGILDEANIVTGETLLDAGCGDGLVAFAALDRVGESGRVIFSDVSDSLLERCREAAHGLGVLGRCDFVHTGADDLGALRDESVDVVTTRSVLIYVRDKRRAFEEFRRVLASRRAHLAVGADQPVQRDVRRRAQQAGGSAYPQSRISGSGSRITFARYSRSSPIR